MNIVHYIIAVLPVNNASQSSQTRTGFAAEGRDMELSEQAWQNISPQFRQWCWKKRRIKINCLTNQKQSTQNEKVEIFT